MEKRGSQRKIRDPKDVLQLLIDDDLVAKDKVGSGAYYWSFPATASQGVKRKHSSIEAKVKAEEERRDRLTAKRDALAADRKQSDQRRAQKQQLQALLAEKNQLSTQLSQHLDSDPEFLKELQKDTIIAKEAANRWTDNADAARKYLRNKYNCEKPTITQLFGDEKEYID